MKEGPAVRQVDAWFSALGERWGGVSLLTAVLFSFTNNVGGYELLRKTIPPVSQHFKADFRLLKV